MGRKRKAASDRKKKKITMELVERDFSNRTSKDPLPYRVCDKLVEQHHMGLLDATIGIAWHLSTIREDADGTIGFGRVKRGNDLDRSMARFDFVLILPKEVWDASDEIRQAAMIDFLLCACADVRDKHGEPAVDERDRQVWRLRKPIKVFAENVRRFGLWQSDKIEQNLELFHKQLRLPGMDSSAPRPKAQRFSEAAIANENGASEQPATSPSAAAD